MSVAAGRRQVFVADGTGCAGPENAATVGPRRQHQRVRAGCLDGGVGVVAEGGGDLAAGDVDLRYVFAGDRRGGGKTGRLIAGWEPAGIGNKVPDRGLGRSE